ncbi:MAG: capsular polysaccharide synthesis protein [Rikenellaceae bacterium]
MVSLDNILPILSTRFKDFFSLWRHYSFGFAINGLLWWICFYMRPPYGLRLSTYFIENKTKWLDRYLENNYSEILERYKGCELPISQVDQVYIWVFWGQGEESMPPLVKACYKQLIHHNDNVCLITMQNIDDYISLDSRIIKKVYNGTIPWANFSDIVRTTLLAKYGGLWVDATVWIAGKISMSELLQHKFYSVNNISQGVPYCKFWSSYDWNWNSFCMWSNSRNYKLFSFVSDMLQALAIKESYWVDYVIQDYLIYYACRNFSDVGYDASNMTIHNEHCIDLVGLLNSPFDQKVYNKLLATDVIFKLRYRVYCTSKTADGQQTFYGRITSGVIE